MTAARARLVAGLRHREQQAMTASIRFVGRTVVGLDEFGSAITEDETHYDGKASIRPTSDNPRTVEAGGRRYRVVAYEVVVPAGADVRIDDLGIVLDAPAASQLTGHTLTVVAIPRAEWEVNRQVLAEHFQ